MDTASINLLLERVGLLLKNEQRKLLHTHGLQPVQFDVLHYLSICNRYSNTPIAVSEYLGQTKGTVSQTIKVLVSKGFVDKVADKKDKRVVHLIVTLAGRLLLKTAFPSELLKNAVGKLGIRKSQALNKDLLLFLKAMQDANDFKPFGQCSSCLYHRHKENGDSFCYLTKEDLSEKDATLICREHDFG